jgi:hypothetical protein
MRTMKRPRRYLAKHWMTLMHPMFRYSTSRDAYVLRGVGSSLGSVVRVDRRASSRGFAGVDRRRASAA